MSLKRRLTKGIMAIAPVDDIPARTPAMRSAHQYIWMNPTHRSVADAEAYVLGLFRSRNPSAALSEIRKGYFEEGTGPNLFRYSFAQAFREARTRGSAEGFRAYLNGNDPYFTFTIVIAGEGGGGYMELGHAGQKMKLAAPFRQGAVESELTDDILDHRRLASDFSLKGRDGFRTTALHYRSYLLSACAMVEAFLNRCVLLEVKRRQSKALEELQAPCSVERRFELWLQEFAGASLAHINSGVEWSDYQELRQRRNELMHPAHSIFGIALKDVARQLNLVRRGVGGLINPLRTLQNLPPVPFAERLETAPETHFRPDPRDPVETNEPTEAPTQGSALPSGLTNSTLTNREGRPWSIKTYLRCPLDATGVAGPPLRSI